MYHLALRGSAFGAAWFGMVACPWGACGHAPATWAPEVQGSGLHKPHGPLECMVWFDVLLLGSMWVCHVTWALEVQGLRPHKHCMMPLSLFLSLHA